MVSTPSIYMSARGKAATKNVSIRSEYGPRSYYCYEWRKVSTLNTPSISRSNGRRRRKAELRNTKSRSKKTEEKLTDTIYRAGQEIKEVFEYPL